MPDRQRERRPTRTISVVPRRLHLAVLSLAVTAALFSPTAASAERWVGADGSGDVEGWHFAPEPEPCGAYTDIDATANTNDDLTRLVVRHTRRDVHLTARFRDLDPAREQSVTLHLTSGSSRGWFFAINRYRAPSGKFRFLSILAKEPSYPDPEDIEDECGAFGFFVFGMSCRERFEVDLEANAIRATVPRSCLKNPRWVRVGVTANGHIAPKDPADETSVGFSDEWGSVDEATSPWLPAYGPKVRAPHGARVGSVGPAPAQASPHRRYVVSPRLP